MSWNAARGFCRRLTERDTLRYRLPTEAEWECACRAGSQRLYYNGDDPAGLARIAWYGKNSEGKTQPVGRKLPNAWGLYDMCGNVWEWCNDWYGGEHYARSPRDDPHGPPSGEFRVVRGGSWYDDARFCRCANRYRYRPENRGVEVGFRVVALRGAVLRR